MVYQATLSLQLHLNLCLKLEAGMHDMDFSSADTITDNYLLLMADTDKITDNFIFLILKRSS